MNQNFYPRSPCGERPRTAKPGFAAGRFLSTLSLRRATAGGQSILVQVVEFLSTLSLRRATQGQTGSCRRRGISIHALLAESDDQRFKAQMSQFLFLSTLSLRRATCYRHPGSCHQPHFYPRSPCGERQNENAQQGGGWQFLSTLSLRRATAGQRPAGGPAANFYPRSPCGERLHLYTSSGVDFAISIHALLAESDAAGRFLLS